MRRSGAVHTPVGHRIRDHLCWVYDAEDTWRGVVSAYLAEGARAHESLLYVAGGDQHSLVDDLAELPSRDSMLHRGQLRVLPVADAYRAVEGLDIDARIRALSEEARSVVKAGYAGLRLAVEGTSLVLGQCEARRLTAYELLVDGMISRNPIVALCGYGHRHIGQQAAAMLCFVHPLWHAGDCHRHGGIHVHDDGRLQLTGEIDASVAEALGVALSALPKERDLHLDLSGLEFIDVSGVRQLVAAATGRSPFRVVLHEPPGLLQQILTLAWPDTPGLEINAS